jgi:RHS repeat-associated protein
MPFWLQTRGSGGFPDDWGDCPDGSGDYPNDLGISQTIGETTRTTGRISRTTMEIIRMTWEITQTTGETTRTTGRISRTTREIIRMTWEITQTTGETTRTTGRISRTTKEIIRTIWEITQTTGKIIRMTGRIFPACNMVFPLVKLDSSITEGSNTKTFDYDADNQLTRAITPGKFLESDSTSGTYGIKIGDYLGAKVMDFTPILTAMMGLDYNSSSIGIDFGSVAPGVKKIQVIPDGKFRAHRITQRSLDLYTSADNTIYTMVPRSNWSFATDSNGIITITFTESLTTRYLKVHVKFDERDSGFTAKNKATFLNDLAKMLRVYQEATSRTEEFHYDAAGNRTYQMVTLIHSNSYTSAYYSNSDRLKTDGKFAFVYDDAGNLVKKGNKFSINGDTVTFSATTGDGVEYWQYTYDLLNRLTEVSKNGTDVSNYEYSPDGLREVKRGSKGTIHYVFEGTEPIFEKRISDGKIKSYVYALGKHLARVDGVIGDSTAKVYYYHTDQAGSVKAVTDQSGKVVFNADYFAFGTKYTSNGDFDETHGFTGKEYDSDTGLYYFNARWYDPDLGRFISEDPVMDPNNPNLYSYCANNPLSNSDPTGLDSESSSGSGGGVLSSIGHAISSAISAVGNAISSAVSSISHAVSSAVSSVASAVNSAVSAACNALSNAWNSATGNKGEKGTYTNPYLPSDSDPEKFIKDRENNDPFHDDDHSGSKYSSEIAKEFGPQLPDFSKTENFVIAIPIAAWIIDGIMGTGAVIATWETFFASKDKQRGKEKARDIIAKEKKGAINREFPKEWEDKTLDEIDEAARMGDKSAQKAKKLLNDHRFDKNDNRK